MSYVSPGRTGRVRPISPKEPNVAPRILRQIHHQTSGKPTTQGLADPPPNPWQIHHVYPLSRYYVSVTDSHSTLPRRMTAAVRGALEDTRVVIINGARQSGKSTLARLILAEMPGSIQYYLDDEAARRAAEADPTGFLRHDGLMLIDEVQRVTELVLGIKSIVDRDTRPGQFLLTGSARLLGMNNLPDSLIGRSETIELWPLSQGEIDSESDSFVDTAFSAGAELRIPPSLETKAHYLDRAIRGGFPEAVHRRDPRRRRRFFESYISDLINRDIKQISDIERPADLRRMLNVLAATQAGLLVHQRIAGDLGLPASTIKRYLDLLELVFLIRRIPAWASNLTARAIATPKLIFTDSGISGHLANWTVGRGSNPVAPVGPFIENFVLSELARQLTWTDVPTQLYHFRTRDGVEVDAILERAGGAMVGIEVKAAESIRSEDFRGLRHLAERVGDRFIAGFVLYCGEHSLSFGGKMAALPISALWRATPE